MDPALIYGPYGAIVLLVIAVVHLYRENTALRQDAMDLLKKYQERDEEERRYWRERERKEREADR
jgi:hypothetical protein